MIYVIFTTKFRAQTVKDEHMETWSISWAVRNLLSELLTPPGILIVWVLLMLFLIKKHELIKKLSSRQVF
jgi:hypothetical protein